MQPKTSRRSFLATIMAGSAAAALSLAGCGSGGGTTKSKSSLTITVKWPTTTSRYVPGRVNSVLAIVYKGTAEAIGDELTRGAINKGTEPYSTVSFADIDTQYVWVKGYGYETAITDPKNLSDNVKVCYAVGQRDLTPGPNDLRMSLDISAFKVTVTLTDTTILDYKNTTATAAVTDETGASIAFTGAEGTWAWKAETKSGGGTATIVPNGMSATITATHGGVVTITATYSEANTAGTSQFTNISGTADLTITAAGYIKVSIVPSGVDATDDALEVAKFGRVKIGDDTTLYEDGATVGPLAAGDHTLAWTTADGKYTYWKPVEANATSVTVSDAATVTITGTYDPKTQLSVIME